MKATLIPNLLLTFLVILSSTLGNAQSSSFEISLKPIEINGLGGIQSYAYGQANGKWLIIGGRLDGLHRRQPWASFDVAGHNNQLIVVDPISLQQWSKPLSSLPVSIQEQLSSTNMEFYQEENYLYCLGGYGYSATLDDHTTFDKLTAIEVDEVIEAVINNTSFTGFFRQITDSQFQVTGGHLEKINNTYYLLGGQKFLGRYNPMGPDHGPGFVQEYTNAIRKFNISDDGDTIIIDHLGSQVDADHLHRRDYNAQSQILPGGEEGIIMFSGVFKPNVDLPYLNAVIVDSTDYEVNNSFQQYYNHYHCPVLPLYSESNSEMHTLFFGGIAQYYDSAGTLVQDDNVPFVNTIARVSLDANGNMAEYKLPIEMPALLGAGAEFIPNLSFPHFRNGVFKLDSIDADSLLIGYIFGGINSSEPNIFFINDGTQSIANPQIFEVYIETSSSLSTDDLNLSSISSLNLLVYPNPSHGELNLSFKLMQTEDVKIKIYNSYGSIIKEMEFKNMSAGEHHIQQKTQKLNANNTYYISLETSSQKVVRKLILAE
ncbi:T9SS type A sorting domain-containing protein [bacterium]|nr:T9SS type A sorting domain-containing protein [bacterium]